MKIGAFIILCTAIGAFAAERPKETAESDRQHFCRKAFLIRCKDDEKKPISMEELTIWIELMYGPKRSVDKTNADAKAHNGSK